MLLDELSDDALDVLLEDSLLALEELETLRDEDEEDDEEADELETVTLEEEVELLLLEALLADEVDELLSEDLLALEALLADDELDKLLGELLDSSRPSSAKPMASLRSV